jgi:L-asparaginase/Glu-tRNA(Gln) amidotransferase subunit D
MTKYKNECNEAEFVAKSGGLALPYQIKSDKPKNLANAIDRFFRRRKIRNVGISIDPNNDSIWIRKR